jgi:hypothetical protein
MLNFLATLVIAASMGTSSNCAAISNFTNQAAWKAYNGQVQYATYRDLGGTRLRWSRHVPKVVRMAEATLTVGQAGFKVAVVCNVNMVLRRR